MKQLTGRWDLVKMTRQVSFHHNFAHAPRELRCDILFGYLCSCFGFSLGAGSRYGLTSVGFPIIKLSLIFIRGILIFAKTVFILKRALISHWQSTSNGRGTSSKKYCLVTVISNECHSTSDDRQLDCLFNSLFMWTTKKTFKLCIIGHLWGNTPVAVSGKFPSQITRH